MLARAQQGAAGPSNETKRVLEEITKIWNELQRLHQLHAQQKSPQAAADLERQINELRATLQNLWSQKGQSGDSSKFIEVHTYEVIQKYVNTENVFTKRTEALLSEARVIRVQSLDEHPFYITNVVQKDGQLHREKELPSIVIKELNKDASKHIPAHIFTENTTARAGRKSYRLTTQEAHLEQSASKKSHTNVQEVLIEKKTVVKTKNEKGEVLDVKEFVDPNSKNVVLYDSASKIGSSHAAHADSHHHHHAEHLAHSQTLPATHTPLHHNHAHPHLDQSQHKHAHHHGQPQHNHAAAHNHAHHQHNHPAPHNHAHPQHNHAVAHNHAHGQHLATSHNQPHIHISQHHGQIDAYEIRGNHVNHVQQGPVHVHYQGPNHTPVLHQERVLYESNFDSHGKLVPQATLVQQVFVPVRP